MRQLEIASSSRRQPANTPPLYLMPRTGLRGGLHRPASTTASLFHDGNPRSMAGSIRLMLKMIGRTRMKLCLTRLRILVEQKTKPTQLQDFKPKDQYHTRISPVYRDRRRLRYVSGTRSVECLMTALVSVIVHCRQSVMVAALSLRVRSGFGLLTPHRWDQEHEFPARY